MTKVIRDFIVGNPYWNPFITPLDLAEATDEQRDALKITPSGGKVSEYVLVLAHDPQSLNERSPLFNAVMYGEDGLNRAERELAALGASIANHCVFCVALHSARYIAASKREEDVEEIFAERTRAKLPPRAQEIFDLSAQLTPHPPERKSESISALRAAGVTDLEIFDLIFCSAMFGWANRLMGTLGEPLESKPVSDS
jgi:uncharacterized peroxidase-related enzyme